MNDQYHGDEEYLRAEEERLAQEADDYWADHTPTNWELGLED